MNRQSNKDNMAYEVSLTDLGTIVPRSSDTFEGFLELVQKGTKDEVDNFLLPLIGTAENTGDSQNELSKQLEDALALSNVVEVWQLIAKIDLNKSNETLENLNEVCGIIVDRENNKENECNFKRSWDCKKMGKMIKSSLCNMLCWIAHCDEDEPEEGLTEMRSEKERRWIEILSNPLYITLEWLWRNNPRSEYTKGERRKESKFADIIEAALDDAYLLEKIASYEHYYSRDEYKRRAEEYETFAADIVEQVNTSDLNQLHEIMDMKGNGSLLNKTPANFNQSLSLLKLAADKQRKRFVASPNCQYVLNEIVYRGWRNWQDQGVVRKGLWFLIQFALVTAIWFLYIPVRLIRRCCCCSEFEDNCCWKIRKLFEHPYSKFINHTMSYVLFLCLVFASSFQDEFGTTKTGLAWIDYPVLAFVLGLFLQEALEASRQGFWNYFSKWWNVVDTLIVFTFLLAYTVWLTALGYYREWKPRKSAFIVADTVYASATVMAFFHLAHVFQVNSVLGPLQLSLYKMLKDVLKFLAIFLLLYIAFATGVAKIYSYYVASQIKLRELDDSQGHKASHPYGKHTNTFIGMFWLLLGLVEEDKISVEDPAFTLTSTFGRIFMIAHVVCTVIVALNMLIAMMNNSFDKIMENALVEWKFSRTRMWLEWIDKGNTVPVPLNLLYYVLSCLCCIFSVFSKTCCCKERQNDPEQSNSQRQEENQEGQNWIERLCLCCCRCCCSSCICSCGICRSTFECTCCPTEKSSMREDRMKEMKTLVVKYLKDRYSDRWQELTAKPAEHRTTSENP